MLHCSMDRSRGAWSLLLPGLAAACLLAALCSCALPLQWGSYPGDLDSLTGDQWNEDLASLRGELLAHHPDPFHAGRQADFDAIHSALSARLTGVPSGRDTADLAVTGIARMLATVGEGHTSINASPSSYYPLVVRWFGAGASRELRVVRAPRSAAAALGCTVTHVAGQPLAAVLPLVDSCISVDHTNGLAAGEPSVLVNPRLARGLGIADASGIRFTLQPDAGMAWDLEVAETAAGELDLVDAWEGSAIPRALSDLHPAEPRWYDTVGSTLFVQYNSCDLEAWGFFQGIVSELRDGRVDRLVVDLRRNSGGNSVAGTWFARAVSAIPSINRTGGVYILVGPRTFSSAMMLAADFMDMTAARFAGEALAEKVDSWGEVRRFSLPRSGLVVGHSTKFFTYSRGRRLRTADGIIVPDDGLDRVPGYAEWSAGADPVLDLVLGEGTP